MTKHLKSLKLLLYIALFVPLFFINIKDSHDWGDDFAQYIHQALNIAEGRSQSTTGYIFNPDHAFVGPQSYSVGFPLLLSPIAKLCGNNILAFNYFNTALLVILGVLIIIFLKRSVGELVALLSSLIIIYNPWTISFKCEILSDIPFTLFTLLGVMLYSHIKERQKEFLFCMIIGMVIGFLILIRSIGLVLLLAIVLNNLIKGFYLSKMNVKREINLLAYQSLIIVGTTSLFYLLLNNVLFSESDKTLGYFKTLYSHSDLYETILRNFRYYIENFQSFFHPKIILWEFLSLIIKALALTMFIIGFINETFKKISFSEIFVVCYILAISAFPNSTQGFRYLLPMMPFIMFYIVTGIKSIRLTRTFNRNWVAVTLAFVCLLTYKTGFSQIINTQSQTLQGPQEFEAIEAFNYIKNNTLKTDTIVFIKPRALALYTNRHSFTNHPLQDSASISANFKELKPHLFLLMNDIENPALRSYIKSNPLQMKLLFRNKVFELYEQSRR